MVVRYSHWASRPIHIAQNATGKGFVYKPCANWRNGKTKAAFRVPIQK